MDFPQQVEYLRPAIIDGLQKQKQLNDLVLFVIDAECAKPSVQYLSWAVILNVIWHLERKGVLKIAEGGMVSLPQHDTPERLPSVPAVEWTLKGLRVSEGTWEPHAALALAEDIKRRYGGRDE